MSIDDLDLRSRVSCGDDYIEVKDGPHPWSRALRRWCGNTRANYTSPSPSVVIALRTDGSVTGRGFKLTYFTVHKPDIQWKEVTLGPFNYFLFIAFGGVIGGIIFGIGFIYAVRKRGEKRQDYNLGVKTARSLSKIKPAVID